MFGLGYMGHPTAVLQHISVLWEIIRCALEDYPISPDWYSKLAAVPSKLKSQTKQVSLLHKNTDYFVQLKNRQRYWGKPPRQVRKLLKWGSKLLNSSLNENNHTLWLLLESVLWVNLNSIFIIYSFGDSFVWWCAVQFFWPKKKVLMAQKGWGKTLV